MSKEYRGIDVQEEERVLHSGDLWQAAARYCLEYFEEGHLVYDDLEFIVPLVEILLRG